MSFIKNVLAVVTGIFLTFLILFLIMIGMVASSTSEPEPYVRDGTVLRIDLKGMVSERKKDDPFAELMNPGMGPGISLDVFRNSLRKAANDDRIKGVWLNLGYLGSSWTSIDEMRQLLVDFKESGKFIYSYIGDSGTNEAAYYIATASDSIFAQPQGSFEFDGFYIEAQFYRNAFEKFGIKADVIAVGDYKSAADQYRNDRFSQADREQLGEILETLASRFAEAVATYSGKDIDEVHEILNSRPSTLSETAYERGLLDGLKFPFEFEAFLIEKVKTRRLQDISLNRYSRVRPQTVGLPRPSGKEIAIVHLNGPILPSIATSIFNVNDDIITYERFVKILDDLESNDDVTAVVLRINSPGGAVSTSELLRARIRKLADKKPVVASMGSIAASGGYYIAMGADSVLAERNTITGSIGVVLAKLSFSELMSEKIGITTDQVKSHRHADWLSPSNAMSREQLAGLQRDGETIYDEFLRLVSEAREMEFEKVTEVAGGRVWIGNTAVELGLVDEIGGLRDAIKLAAKMAETEQYQTRSYPVPKTFFETIMDSGRQEAQARFLRVFGINNSALELLNQIRSAERPQVFSVVPFEFSVN